MNDAPLLHRLAHDANSAAEMLSVSPRTVRRLVKNGHLAAFLPKGTKRGMHIMHGELERYLAASVEPATDDEIAQPTLAAVKDLADTG